MCIDSYYETLNYWALLVVEKEKQASLSQLLERQFQPFQNYITCQAKKFTLLLYSDLRGCDI